jgi:hypothetical protein
MDHPGLGTYFKRNSSEESKKERGISNESGGTEDDCVWEDKGVESSHLTSEERDKRKVSQFL